MSVTNKSLIRFNLAEINLKSRPLSPTHNSTSAPRPSASKLHTEPAPLPSLCLPSALLSFPPSLSPSPSPAGGREGGGTAAVKAVTTALRSRETGRGQNPGPPPGPNPEPESLNPQPETRDPNPENSKLSGLDPKPYTQQRQGTTLVDLQVTAKP